MSEATVVDTVRYFTALVLVVMFPPAFASWFFIHPFIGFWRRVGPGLTLMIWFSAILAGFYGLFNVRGSLLAVDYGTQWMLVGLGVGVVALTGRTQDTVLEKRTDAPRTLVADEAIQVLGGMGLMDELPLERIWRDARVDRIWDGTSEIQRHIVSREMLRPLGA